MSSALRKRMIDRMIIRHMSEKTIESYVGAVKAMARYYGKSPEELTPEEVQQYLLYLEKHRKLAWSTINIAFSAFRLLYRNVLDRPDVVLCMPPRQGTKRLPRILTVEEVKHLINTPTNLKHRTMLLTAYGCGLRVSEVVRLKTEHIESSPERMLVRVDQGKGRKDRYTILPEAVLKGLREYWKAYRPKPPWLFPGRNGNTHMSVGAMQKMYYAAKEKAGLRKGRGIHTLRHCFASHLLQTGYDIYTIKRIMGHRALATTAKYLHVSPDVVKTIRSPLDDL